MKCLVRLLAICLFAVGFLATNARGDVVYTFSGTTVFTGIFTGTEILPVGFTYTAEDFLTSATPLTAVYASQLDACLNCFAPVPVIAPVVAFQPNFFNGVLGDSLAFVDVNDVAGFYQFPLGAFSSPGTYASTAETNHGTLTVSVVAVAEPGWLSLTLVGTILALVCSCKRKGAKATQPA